MYCSTFVQRLRINYRLQGYLVIGGFQTVYVKSPAKDVEVLENRCVIKKRKPKQSSRQEKN